MDGGAEPLPVHAIFALAAGDSDIALKPAPPTSAFWLLWNNTNRRWAMGAMSHCPAHFCTVTAMARSVRRRGWCGHGICSCWTR